MNGKGDRRRPIYIGPTEEKLRWELVFNCVNDPERKEEILKLLEEMIQYDSPSNL